MRVNADSLLIRAAATSTSGTLNDLTTDLIMANNNNNIRERISLVSHQVVLHQKIPETTLSQHKSIGQNVAKSFVEDRMTSETDKIFIPIKTNKLKTFSSIGKTEIVRLISETVSIKASSDMFNRLFIIGKSRDIDMEELLSYAGTREMPGYPWATHFFTGCDCISAFKGKGKTTPLGLMRESEAFC